MATEEVKEGVYISKIDYNWHQAGEFGDRLYDDFHRYEVGKLGVTHIRENNKGQPTHFAEVFFENGEVHMIKNINQIYYKPKEQGKDDQ